MFLQAHLTLTQQRNKKTAALRDRRAHPDYVVITRPARETLAEQALLYIRALTTVHGFR